MTIHDLTFSYHFGKSDKNQRVSRPYKYISNSYHLSNYHLTMSMFDKFDLIKNFKMLFLRDFFIVKVQIHFGSHLQN